MDIFCEGRVQQPEQFRTDKNFQITARRDGNPTQIELLPHE